jgi:malonyl CoA-acyl carrier protein transacylase
MRVPIILTTRPIEASESVAILEASALATEEIFGEAAQIRNLAIEMPGVMILNGVATRIAASAKTAAERDDKDVWNHKHSRSKRKSIPVV